ncbi:hypothetical protein [Candidatus Magnetobacterium casense]|uniref:Uncharacterized protein n=1 Tax=Candidatus Magnetobacterium casense TaxID=1455061 RepID=A0ABS6S2R4_9BACT|nr:hypothetical protein [Candidatus Magnetobacterium casensis]MBV6342880.1 hypothetical protein [Candidatus Magnetobacterium casensis]
MAGGPVVALKASCKDLLSGAVRDGSRVNVIGTVVGSASESPPAFVMDDRTAIILVREFDKIVPVVVGSVVAVIGWLRVFGNENYVAAEIVRQLDSRWLDVRAKELASGPALALTAAGSGVSGDSDIRKMADDILDSEAVVLKLVRELDSGSGAPTDDVLAQAGKDAEGVVALLLERGDIFEASPGRLKILG